MNAVAMIEAGMVHQVAPSAYPSMGTARPDPDPVNHEVLVGVADSGIEGHARDLRGVDDALVPDAAVFP